MGLDFQGKKEKHSKTSAATFRKNQKWTRLVSAFLVI